MATPNNTNHPDLEAGHHDSTTNHELDSRPSTPPPKYMEADMVEPLPPYMERLRMVVMRQQPLSTAMPDRRYGWRILVTFLVIILIVVGVSIGASLNNRY